MQKYIKEIIIFISILLGIITGIILIPQHYEKVYYNYKHKIKKIMKEIK